MNSALLRLRFVPTPAACQRHLPGLAWWVALAIAAWFSVDLFWRLAAPRPTRSLAVAESDPARAAERIAARQLFGAPASPAAAADGGQILLFGAVAGEQGQAGFAILSLAGRPPMAAVSGQEVAPGLVLSAIRADRIELSGAGGRRTVLLQPMPAGVEGSSRNSGAPGAMRAAPPQETARSTE